VENYANCYKGRLAVPDEAVQSVPWAMGREQETIHIYEVDYRVEQIRDGAMPGVVGKWIGERGLRHMGFHSEMMADTSLKLLKKGVITEAKKQIDQSEMVYIFALGSKMLYDYITRNLTYATYAVKI